MTPGLASTSLNKTLKPAIATRDQMRHLLTIQSFVSYQAIGFSTTLSCDNTMVAQYSAYHVERDLLVVLNLALVMLKQVASYFCL